MPQPVPARARGGPWVAGQLALIALLLVSARAGTSWPEHLRTVAHATGGAFLAAGLSLLIAGGVQLALVSSLTPFPAPTRDGQLLSSGVYRLVRHPMYGGGMLVALGWSILFASIAGIVVTVALTAFLATKARREEAWLVERYPGYEAYRRRTRRGFVPFLY